MGKWSYRSYPNESGEWFAARQTWHPKDPEDIINFWHITEKHTHLYTFYPTEKYNRGADWSENLCYAILADLKSQKPSMNVVRYVVDEQQIFSDMKGKSMPKTPEVLKAIPQPNPEADKIRKQKYKRYKKNVLKAQKRGRKKGCGQKRMQIEAAKACELAPFIVYGKHNNGGSKEYAWRLTPDKPKRQGIQPGDCVLVWTKYGFCQVTVTRIEEAGNQEQPEARVKKKLFSKNTGELEDKPRRQS